MSWADIAVLVFQSCGRPASAVTRVSTAEYAAGRAMAPRPVHSTLSLDKIEATGYQPTDLRTGLARFLASRPVHRD
jgi:dTDP-4-dehydrorhamnose 3,5-epimerase